MKPMAREIKLMVVDDHPVMAMGVERLLSSIPGFHVVATCNSGREFLNGHDLAWNVVVLDLNLSDGSGLDLLDHVRCHYPERRAVIYSVAPVEQMGLIAMARGASAYISKGDDPRMLVQAVEHAAMGKRFVTPAIAEILMDGGARTRVLTDREIELLQLLASGIRPSGIADHLHITRATVSGHLASARRKLGARSNVELVRLFERGQSA